MKLKLERFQALVNCTIGKLSVDGEYFCYTLEDLEREEKIYGETAIPKGTYKIVIDYSHHFKSELPRLLEVPGYEGVRIHPGNRAADTEGCILVGKSWDLSGVVTESRAAFMLLMGKLTNAQGEITLEIV